MKPKSSNDFSNSRRRYRSPVGFQSNNRRQSESMVAKPPGKNLVMGQVKIMKRGKTLIAAAEKTDCAGVYGSRVKMSLIWPWDRKPVGPRSEYDAKAN
ncbi:hypothetical protein CRYUN_Cryun30bG0079400 [Craigia yunnanensis]